MTLGSIPLGQFIGSLVSVAFFFIAGAYLLWIWPVEVRRKVESGKLSESEAKEKLRKANPKFGYFAFLAAVCQLIIVLMQWFSRT